MTPLWIFLGIRRRWRWRASPAIFRLRSPARSTIGGGAPVDLALAFVLLAGGLIGTVSGVWLFTLLRAIGQLDITIGISYVLLLGIVGSLMVIESVRAIMRARQGKPVELRRPGSHTWIHGLPLSCSNARASTCRRFWSGASAS